jgi:hypothetical protein
MIQDPRESVSIPCLTELEMMHRAMEAEHARNEPIRRDAYRRVLASARTMTREMLIQWLEREIS